jgi:hypothetical protein
MIAKKKKQNAISILNIGKCSKVYKQGIFHAISFAVTDN